MTLGPPSEGTTAQELECGAAYGIVPGVELELTVEGYGEGRACIGGNGPLEGVPGLLLTPADRGNIPPGNLVSAQYRYVTSAGGCSGLVNVAASAKIMPAGAWDGQGTPDAGIWFGFIPDFVSDECGHCRIDMSTTASLK